MAATLETLVETYNKSRKNNDKLRGWKRSLTVFCQKESEKTGRTQDSIRTSVKNKLKKQGSDVTSL